VQAKEGDFTFTAAASLKNLGGFSGSFGARVIRLGSTAQVQVAGAITVPGGSASGKAMLARQSNGTVYYDFQAQAALTISGYSLLDMQVRVKNDAAGFAATASGRLGFTVPGVSGQVILAGSFGAPPSGPMTYSLSAGVTLSLVGVNVAGSLTFSSSVMSFSFNLGTATVFNVQATGTLWSNGNFNVSTSLSFVGLTANVVVSRSGSAMSVAASLSYKGKTFASVTFSPGKVTANVNFAFGGSGHVEILLVRVGGTFHVAMNLGVVITRSGGTYQVSGTFSGFGYISAWIQGYGCSGWKCPFKGWSWGSKKSLGSIGASVKTNGEACATISGKTFCKS